VHGGMRAEAKRGDDEVALADEHPSLDADAPLERKRLPIGSRDGCDVERRIDLCQSTVVVPEAGLEQTEHGVAPRGEGWFVLNARDARWYDRGSRGAVMTFEGDPEFSQVGVNLFVLGPGQPMAMYHWEADQEDFLVLSGEALLIIEGEERPLRQWDFVHCPPDAEHTIVGAGSGPAAILAIGARDNQDGEGWGGYHYSELAMRHDASAESDTNDPREAYARFPARQPCRYREGWLP
jgi:uncharacterized cupin superfamily protein